MLKTWKSEGRQDKGELEKEKKCQRHSAIKKAVWAKQSKHKAKEKEILWFAGRIQTQRDAGLPARKQTILYRKIESGPSAAAKKTQ